MVAWRAPNGGNMVSGQPRDDAGAAASALMPQNGSGFTQRLARRTAVHRDDLRFQKARGCAAVTLRKLPNPPLCTRPRRLPWCSRRQRTPVASVLGRDRIVDLHPNRTCLHRHRRPRVTGCAAMGHEGIVDVDQFYAGSRSTRNQRHSMCPDNCDRRLDDQPRFLAREKRTAATMSLVCWAATATLERDTRPPTPKFASGRAHRQ
jgi:hypothetical protein